MGGMVRDSWFESGFFHYLRRIFNENNGGTWPTFLLMKLLILLRLFFGRCKSAVAVALSQMKNRWWQPVWV